MALADPSYDFLYVDIGINGRVDDGGVWNKSRFSKALENNKLFFHALDDYLEESIPFKVSHLL